MDMNKGNFFIRFSLNIKGIRKSFVSSSVVKKKDIGILLTPP